MTLNAQRRKASTELDAPRTGRGADAYEVACTALWLRDRKRRAGEVIGVEWLAVARHATVLHVISGRLHRLAERECNEDLTCPRCKGEGDVYIGARSAAPDGQTTCRACAGHGTTTGRTLHKLRHQAEDIAAAYGCRPYFQTDPRGCALYLIPLEAIPTGDALREAVRQSAGDRMAASEPDSLVRYWCSIHNDSHGHAVVRMGA